MRRRIWVMAALALLALPKPGLADNAAVPPNWVLVEETDDGKARDYLDIASIVKNGDIARIRMRSEFAAGSGNLTSGEGLFEVNCKTNKGRLLEMHLVNTQGKKQSITEPSEWTNIVLKSPAYAAAKAACGWNVPARREKPPA